MRFEHFEIDEDGYQLREAGKPVRLERIPMELLMLLARNPSRLVSRDEIVAQIWGVNHFLESESAVNTAVRKLRKALKDDASSPRFIETVPGKGYRFTAKAITGGPNNGSRAPHPEAVRLFLQGRHVWNKKTPQAYEQAIGLFQEAIDHDASFAQPYVGLAYCYVMMGIHGLKPAADVYPLARAAAASALELDPQSAEAMTAMADVTKGFDWEWGAAEGQYQRALQLNPDYPVAHQWYANLLSILGRHDEAIAEAVEARRHDPLSVGPSGFVGFTLYRARRFAEALRECRRTLEVHRNAPIAMWFMANVLVETGSLGEAEECLMGALNLAPSSAMHLALLALVLGRAGRTSEAMEALGKLKESAERRYISPVDLAIAYLGSGGVSEAVLQFKKAIAERVMRATELPMPLYDELRKDRELAEFCERLHV